VCNIRIQLFYKDVINYSYETIQTKKSVTRVHFSEK